MGVCLKDVREEYARCDFIMRDWWCCTKRVEKSPEHAIDAHSIADMKFHASDFLACGAHGNWLGDDQLEEIDEDVLDSLMNDDVKAVSEDVEGLDEELIEAVDVFAQTMRSFAEARDVVRRLRVSRGYCPIARPLVFDRRSKGKGRGKKDKGKCGKLYGKGQTKDTEAYLREGKGKDNRIMVKGEAHHAKSS